MGWEYFLQLIVLAVIILRSGALAEPQLPLDPPGSQFTETVLDLNEGSGGDTAGCCVQSPSDFAPSPCSPSLTVSDHLVPTGPDPLHNK
ncbi:hypothetical protein O6H91_17G084400 [Diphasiastrum complanatum]|uniref:Uncharacterized protein n=1 Tax=Diphasiastrum complanatum TaxID=34168 RepID=A0ACC2B8T2_DIPCM|nr:hypothetical protein O6H91_Y105000 [Diphasiastrum complanatum]KAJ7526154.1 hypothetical protein O6H91_17G084400 [Diphasiastrum complanatum]